ncbi:unnamed protein product [Ceratitis capitata]|uniref:(Mediterranean fruit fly) hypothetical protein n=1 Tax=Ceratitis capitata TaxID=7213 RepID=A0A811U8W5_CERCA|nr:unnamed protein product [Ceratitis capitata]
MSSKPQMDDDVHDDVDGVWRQATGGFQCIDEGSLPEAGNLDRRHVEFFLKFSSISEIIYRTHRFTPGRNMS